MGWVLMSDNEARERRRAKILASKDDRMARIVGSISGASSDSNDSLPSSTRPTEKVQKTQTPSNIKKSPVANIKAEVLESKSIPTEISKNLPTSDKSIEMHPTYQRSNSSLLHRALIIVAAVLFILSSRKCFALSKYFNASLLKQNICPIIEDAPWSILISIFLSIEFGEFIFGRLQYTKGTNTIIVKDLCLYVFIILVLSQF